MDKTYTPNQVADIMGVSAQAVRHWVREGTLLAHRVGGSKKPRIRIPQEEVNRLLEGYKLTIQ